MPGRDERFKGDLRKAVILNQKQPQETSHVSTLVGCEVEVEAIALPDGAVALYRLVINDPKDRHKYYLPFAQEGKEALIAMLQDTPNVGEKVPQAQDNGEDPSDD